MPKAAPPNTPFSTPLSGSAKEAEERIRNIFQYKKTRPPALFLALACALALLCGGLVSCQPQSPAVSLSQEEETLLSLLAAEDQSIREEGDEPRLLASIQQGDYLLGAAAYSHRLGDTLLIGVMDRKTGELTADRGAHRSGVPAGDLLRHPVCHHLPAKWGELPAVYPQRHAPGPFGRQLRADPSGGRRLYLDLAGGGRPAGREFPGFCRLQELLGGPPGPAGPRRGGCVCGDGLRRAPRRGTPVGGGPQRRGTCPSPSPTRPGCGWRISPGTAATPGAPATAPPCTTSYP